MDLDAFKTKLNTRLDDTDNFAFTADEKEEALTEAINDHATLKPVWDSSLTFDSQTWQYSRPAGIDVIQDIYIQLSTDSEPQPISSSLWEVVVDKIHFKPNAFSAVPDNTTLYLKGSKKYTTSDTLTETNIQEFVLNLAQLNCLNMFGIKKTLKFLKNDTSMNEIVTIKRELERKVAQYRQRLPRSFEGA